MLGVALTAATLAGCPLFPADFTTNQRVDHLPVASSSDAMPQSRPVWSIAFTMVSLAKTSSFCWTSPCTFSFSAEPRMSARPALRTLFAIIFAARAMSYRMPES